MSNINETKDQLQRKIDLLLDLGENSICSECPPPYKECDCEGECDCDPPEDCPRSVSGNCQECWRLWIDSATAIGGS